MRAKKAKRTGINLAAVVVVSAALAGCSAANHLATPDPAADLDTALARGDASFVQDERVFIDAILDEIEQGRRHFRPIFDALLPTGPARLEDVRWRPTLQSAWLEPEFPRNTPIIEAKLLSFESGLPAQGLAIVGETAAARYVVFNANPLREPERLNDATRRFLDNTYSWLAHGRHEPIDVAIAHMDNSAAFPDEDRIRAWLGKQTGAPARINRAGTCDGGGIARCLGEADLLIISQLAGDGDDPDEIVAAVDEAMQRGVSVMYVHHDSDLTDLGRGLLRLLHVTYRKPNQWYEPEARPPAMDKARAAVPTHIADIEAVLRYLRDGGIAVDLSACADRTCPADSWYTTTFRPAVRSIRFIVDALDESRQNVFDLREKRLEKLLVLLGDHWRSRASFPIDARSTDPATLFRSLFADYVVHLYRPDNPAQPDMGTYSRPDFSHIEPVSKKVTMTPQPDYRSAGVYALPGQSVTVTRLDAEASVGTRLRVNSLREFTTHLFDEDAYTRPLFAGTTPSIAIAPGESITFTSPYGGPLHVYFDDAGQDVSFRFDNVGLHPYWNGPGDSARFVESLQADDYDWAEFANPYFEITSRARMMQATMAHDLVAGSPGQLSDLITQYHHNIPRSLAAYRGHGIDVPGELTDFAAEHGLSLTTWDKVQHLNADQSLCGSACAGNPYDSSWAFMPLGHGHLHELGHGLEAARTRFSTWPVHASTNWYVYFTKLRFHEQSGTDTGCHPLPYRELFDLVQESRRQPDPAAYIAAADDGDLAHGATIMMQMLAAAQHTGGLDDGWMLLSRLQLIARQFDDAILDPTRWNVLRDGLGFGDMSMDRAKSLSREDWLLIAASHASGIDFAPFLETWGAPIDPDVRDYVARRGYAEWAPTFYALQPVQHCYTDLGEAIAVPADGRAAWPFPD